MKIRSLLKITDLSVSEALKVLAISERVKKELKRKGENKPILERKTLAMIFEKPSLRTRISFEIGMTQLGGHAIYLGPSDIQMGKRESAHDVGVVTSSMADIIMARTFEHSSVVELASGSAVPVINGLSNLEHPCQILADYLTIKEKLGRLENLNVVFVGDGNNNVTHSLALLSVMLGNEFVVVAPKKYWMNPKILKETKKFSGSVVQTDEIESGVKGADVVVADTWVSMGAEGEKGKRLKTFMPYQVTSKVMANAKKKSIFMHCLPAYREKEVATDVIDGPQSVVFDEAENRLHAQKGLMLFLLGINY